MNATEIIVCEVESVCRFQVFPQPRETWNSKFSNYSANSNAIGMAGVFTESLVTFALDRNQDRGASDSEFSAQLDQAFGSILKTENPQVWRPNAFRLGTGLSHGYAKWKLCVKTPLDCGKPSKNRLGSLLSLPVENWNQRPCLVLKVEPARFGSRQMTLFELNCRCRLANARERQFA